MADDPSEENIELFTDLQEQFQTNGGYEAESVMARLADGLGLRQELLLEDIDELSGGQRRRVDLMRVLFLEPELMILDEPTNHLDRSAKRWLLDELARFAGALLVVSHDLKLLDHSITKVLHISNQRLTEWKGNYSRFGAQHEADQTQRERRPSWSSGRSPASRPWPTPCGRAPRSRARKAKSFDKRVERMEAGRTHVDKRERASKFKLPTPPRSGATPLEVAKLGVRYGSNEVLTDVTFHAGRGDHIVIIGRNGAGKSSLLRCLAGVQEPSTRRGGARCQRRGGLLRGRSTSRSTRPAARGQRQRRRPQGREGPSGAAGVVRPAGRGRRSASRDAVGGRAGQARAGDALGRGGEPAAARRAHQQPGSLVHRRRRRHARRMAGDDRGREP